eukprot:121416-Amphidinium_carterae.1
MHITWRSNCEREPGWPHEHVEAVEQDPSLKSASRSHRESNVVAAWDPPSIVSCADTLSKNLGGPDTTASASHNFNKPPEQLEKDVTHCGQ